MRFGSPIDDKVELETFCDLTNLTNLIDSETCFKKNRSFITDLSLIHKSLSLQKTDVSEIG